jgi:hypothetical protein
MVVKATGTMKVSSQGSHPGVQAHRPASGLEHALEDDQHVLQSHEPEGERGRNQPEAVDDVPTHQPEHKSVKDRRAKEMNL